MHGTTFKLTEKGSTTKVGAVITYSPDDLATTDTLEARATLDQNNSLQKRAHLQGGGHRQCLESCGFGFSIASSASVDR
jgi:hypothetical protein